MVYTVDSVGNLITGMGTMRSRSFATAFTYEPMAAPEIEAAYRGSWLAAKIVDIPAFDMCRAWRDWQADDDDIAAIEREERRLNLRGKVLDAKIKARLFGGAAILIGDGSPNPSLPLQPESIGRGGLKYLTVMMADKLTAGPIDQDVESEWYGQPSHYRLQRHGGSFYPPKDKEEVVLHPSRVVRFFGKPIQTAHGLTTNEWGDSALQAVKTAVLQALSVATNTADLTHEAKIDVLGVKDLMMMSSDPEYEARFQKRASLAMLSKSMHNTLIRDAEETYEQKQVAFATLPELIDRFFQISSGAADIPATRLLGQSPAGLSATGESDLRNYYDRVGAGQELELRPAMATLDECVIWSALGKRDPDTHYAWAPLWQMSEVDHADVTLKKAQAFQIDVNSGLFPDSALAKARKNQLSEDSVYPGLDKAMKEAKAEGDAIDFGEKANAPEPQPVAQQRAPATEGA